MWVKGRDVIRCSRHRKAQRFAAARDVDDSKADRGQTARAAVALFADLELARAGAKLCFTAPVQRSLLDSNGAIVGVDGFREAENALRLADDVRMKTFAG